MQALEQMVRDTLAQPTIDVYTNGLAELYTGMGGSPFGPPAWMFDPMQSPMANWAPEPLQGYGVGNQFQTTLPQYFEPVHFEPSPIEIVPYNKGMDLDGGLNLYWNPKGVGTAILRDNSLDLEYHHHVNGPGSINFGDDRLFP